ncbi:MAG: tetratricopeptide repeat protein [Bernardetiaceae bacterium]|nr:tetratricopeptide repeat protein [Bernardetiaceae bacterium]
MPKSQILLVVAGILLLVTLMFLPKIVVENEREKLAATTQEAGSNSESQTQDVAEQMHHTTLAEEEKPLLEAWIAKLQSAENKDDAIQALDSVIMYLRKATLFDSAAYVAERTAQRFPSLETDRIAAKAYYEAYSFAINPEKMANLGKKTAQLYQKVLEKDPNDLDAKANYAMTFVTTETPMQGITLLREIVTQDPKHAKALTNLGLLSMRSGQYAKAVARFEVLLENYPDDLNAYLYLGVSYIEVGRKEEGRKHLEYVIEHAKDEALRTTAKQYLK